MKPGLDLDKLIGEKIMGWSDAEEYEAYGGRGVQAVMPGTVAGLNTGYKAKVPMPKWSTDIAAAWQVVEKMHQLGKTFHLNSDNAHPPTQWWDCAFSWRHNADPDEWIREADTASYAICMAALSALEIL